MGPVLYFHFNFMLTRDQTLNSAFVSISLYRLHMVKWKIHALAAFSGSFMMFTTFFPYRIH